jgi:hypothetical protein
VAEFNGIATISILIIGSPKTKQISKNDSKHLHRYASTKKRPHDITKMKDNTNMASPIGGSLSVRN